MTIDPSRLVRAANEYLDAGIDVSDVAYDAARAIYGVDANEIDEGDVLELIAAVVVLADNLGYSLDDVLTKFESKGAQRLVEPSQDIAEPRVIDDIDYSDECDDEECDG